MKRGAWGSLAFATLLLGSTVSCLVDTAGYEVVDDVRACDFDHVNVSTDVDNCGSCGNSCHSDETCAAGKCTCVESGTQRCGSECVDTQSDHQNCGECARACGTLQTCVSGACTCPSASDTKCGDSCANLQSDSSNCGSCNVSCMTSTMSVVHLTASCTAGVCTAPACSKGYADCDKDIATGSSGNGCEIDIDSDSKNCGGCAIKCTARQGCVSAKCLDFDVVIRAYVDGKSQLKLSPSGVRWHHVQWSAPGRIASKNEATFVNGTAWLPVWPDKPTPENRDCNCDSSIFTGYVRPATAQIATLTKIDGRSTPKVTQQPTAQNGYTTILEIEDPPVNADWYEIGLKYK